MDGNDDGITDDLGSEVTQWIDLYLAAVRDWSQARRDRNLTLIVAGSAVLGAIVWSLTRKEKK